MATDTYKISKNICTFCQTPIKNEEEEYLCSSCNSPYHKDCWAENKGCAVYGCGEKLRDKNEDTIFREAVINIEYLINRNQFSEAIFEAKQYLKIERRNPEFKNLYNRAVSLINNKINLMTSGDEAFGKKDYRSAEIYYKNVLKYTDEVETNFITARLEICKEKIPEQKRRRFYQNALIIAIIIAILAAIGYLGYYTLVLKEDREFAELLKSDNAFDLNSTEKMIGKYENYLRDHMKSKNKVKAMERVTKYSYIIANEYYKDDWKLALKYYNKISKNLNSEDEKILKNKIYNVAFNDFRQKTSNARKLNSISKYGEALNELNNAMLIASSFPESDIGREVSVIESNIQLLSKKLASVLKGNDIEREIREKDKQLSYLGSSGNKGVIKISVRLNKFIEPNIYIGKEPADGKYIAIKSTNKSFSVGEMLNTECYPDGKITIEVEKENKQTIPLYIPYFESDNYNPSEVTNSEKEAIYERLKTLRIQKEKIDSIMKMSLL